MRAAAARTLGQRLEADNVTIRRQGLQGRIVLNDGDNAAMDVVDVVGTVRSGSGRFHGPDFLTEQGYDLLNVLAGRTLELAGVSRYEVRQTRTCGVQTPRSPTA